MPEPHLGPGTGAWPYAARLGSEVARLDPVTVTGPVVGVDRGSGPSRSAPTGPGSTAPGRLRDTTAASVPSASMRCTRPTTALPKPQVSDRGGRSAGGRDG